MRILVCVVVVSMQHLLLSRKQDGWGEGLQGHSPTINSDMLVSMSAENVSWTNSPLIDLWCNSLNEHWAIYLCNVLFVHSLLPTHPCKAVCLQRRLIPELQIQTVHYDFLNLDGLYIWQNFWQVQNMNIGIHSISTDIIVSAIKNV